MVAIIGQILGHVQQLQEEVSGMITFSEALILWMEEGRVGAGGGETREMGFEANRLPVSYRGVGPLKLARSTYIPIKPKSRAAE